MTIPFFNLSRFYEKHKNELNSLSGKVFSSGRWMDGNHIAELESNLAKLFNRKYAITTGSCTDALYFALLAAGIKPGDEIIVPSFSFIASVTPVIRAGAVPIFLDSLKDSNWLCIEEVERKITSKTKAILAIHLFGDYYDVEPLKKLADKYKLVLIEDAAQSINNSHSESKNYSKIMCLSFDPTKVINAFGSGGAVLCDNKQIYDQIIQLRYHGKSDQDYTVKGFNSRISELQASFLNYQLNIFQEILGDRKRIAFQYFELLSGIKNIELPQKENNFNWHKFVIKCKNRDALRSHLKESDIDTLIHYPKPLFEYSVIKNNPHKAEGISQVYITCSEVLSLPIYNYMTDQEIEYICNTIKSFKVS